MNSIMRTSMYAAGATVCAIVLRYVDYPDSVMACLAVAIAVFTTDGIFRMCDRLLDPPSAIIRLICGNPRIISGMPPHDLTVSIDPIKHKPHSLANASNGRTTQ